MDGDAHGDTIHQTYHEGLRSQHALEKSAIELCNRQVERLTHYPELKARLAQHAQESEAQHRRLDEILARHETSRSALKDAWTTLTGNLAAAAHTVASDEVLKNLFADFAFEHFEIAAYTSLIAMAEAVGDIQSVPLLQQSLAEEKAMAAFLEQAIEPTTARYLSLLGAGETAKV